MIRDAERSRMEAEAELRRKNQMELKRLQTQTTQRTINDQEDDINVADMGITFDHYGKMLKVKDKVNIDTTAASVTEMNGQVNEDLTQVAKNNILYRKPVLKGSLLNTIGANLGGQLSLDAPVSQSVSGFGEKQNTKDVEIEALVDFDKVKKDYAKIFNRENTEDVQYKQLDSSYVKVHPTFGVRLKPRVYGPPSPAGSPKFK